MFGITDSWVQNASIAASKDVDFYRFYATKGTTVRARSTTTALDTYVRLYNASGGVVKTGDQAAASGTDSVTYSLPRSDYYFVAVSSYGNRNYDPFRSSSGPGGSTGSYRVSIELSGGNTARVAQDVAISNVAHTHEHEAPSPGSNGSGQLQSTVPYGVVAIVSPSDFYTPPAVAHRSHSRLSATTASETATAELPLTVMAELGM